MFSFLMFITVKTYLRNFNTSSFTYSDNASAAKMFETSQDSFDKEPSAMMFSSKDLLTVTELLRKLEKRLDSRLDNLSNKIERVSRLHFALLSSFVYLKMKIINWFLLMRFLTIRIKPHKNYSVAIFVGLHIVVRDW